LLFGLSLIVAAGTGKQTGRILPTPAQTVNVSSGKMSLTCSSGRRATEPLEFFSIFV
jgi:hypothetical protein